MAMGITPISAVAQRRRHEHHRPSSIPDLQKLCPVLILAGLIKTDNDG